MCPYSVHLKARIWSNVLWAVCVEIRKLEYSLSLTLFQIEVVK